VIAGASGVATPGSEVVTIRSMVPKSIPEPSVDPPGRATHAPWWPASDVAPGFVA
jgi:hypothetical protein